MNFFRFCESLRQQLGIRKDARSSSKELPRVTLSRKQDRKDGLLGWWVFLVLILLSLAWKPAIAVDLEHHRREGGEGGFGKPRGSLPASSFRKIPQFKRSQVDPQILKAALGMEAIFLNQMFKVMRQTIPKNEMDLESPATEIYRGMMDSEYADRAAKHGGIGLADQIIAYLDSQRYNQRQGQEVQKRRNHEGQPSR